MAKPPVSGNAYRAAESTEEYHCSFGLNGRYRRLIESGPLCVSALDDQDEIRAVELDGGSVRCDLGSFETNGNRIPAAVKEMRQSGDVEGLFRYALDLASWPAAQLRRFCQALADGADSLQARMTALEALTVLHDRRFDLGDKRRATAIEAVEASIDRLLDSAPLFGEPPALPWRRIDWATRGRLAAPLAGEDLLVINAALDLYFVYQENRRASIQVQQEKAENAAQKIESFVREIERQMAEPGFYEDHTVAQPIVDRHQAHRTGWVARFRTLRRGAVLIGQRFQIGVLLLGPVE